MLCVMLKMWTIAIFLNYVCGPLWGIPLLFYIYILFFGTQNWADTNYTHISHYDIV